MHFGGLGCLSRLPVRPIVRLRAYATTADARAAGCFAGASTIRATPMMTRAAEPQSSPRTIRLRNAWNDMTAAWAKLDQAVKAIRLRFADGFRAAIIKKMPSVT